MGIRHRQWPLCGVQFHPESFMTEFGLELVENFLRLAPGWERARASSLDHADRFPRVGSAALDGHARNAGLRELVHE